MGPSTIKQENKNIIPSTLFLTISVLLLKYRGFHGNIYKARAALKCCNKSLEMERKHVICGLQQIYPYLWGLLQPFRLL